MKTFSSVVIASLTMVGMASAQPAPAKGAPATPAKSDKAPAVAPVPPKDTKAAPPAMPTVPAEVAELGKAMSGTWKCKGDSFGMGGVKTPMTATNKVKVDFDKWWISESLDVKAGPMKFKMQTFTTYDAAAKKWRRVGIDSMGGQMVGTADGTAAGTKMTFNMDMMGPMGAGQFRDYFDPTDMKAGLKVWGEMSMDKGKTWTKAYEQVCKK